MLSIANGFTTSVGIPNTTCLRMIINVDEAVWDNGYESNGNKGPYMEAVIEEG